MHPINHPARIDDAAALRPCAARSVRLRHASGKAQTGTRGR
jgi:hypothetical protein